MGVGEQAQPHDTVSRPHGGGGRLTTRRKAGGPRRQGDIGEHGDIGDTGIGANAGVARIGRTKKRSSAVGEPIKTWVTAASGDAPPASRCRAGVSGGASGPAIARKGSI